ncbi:HGxxPAAW family protein [Streptomyces sp. NBC_01190]|uniref:HGxxPAAW family protein n=1 Tax=Streptomyces sp. NBC_01190 TaxID=2903767 RepID=UPI003864D1D9|nr:hypothetical protein OG519_07615 [Streptomyces sp. NBC_01190]
MAATHDHGHTPAAWTGVIISFIGFCAAGGFMVAAEPVGFWVSIGLILLGPIVGGAMKIMGFGAKPSADLLAARRDAANAEQEAPRPTANA